VRQRSTRSGHLWSERREGWREIRKANIPAREPAVSRYAEMIENNKVREGERTIRGSESL
jgi:hypothetical protein